MIFSGFFLWFYPINKMIDISNGQYDESQIWFDLVRTKRLVDAIKNTNFRGNLKNNGPANITDKNYVYPIPQTEILNNNAISQADQNEGY